MCNPIHILRKLQEVNPGINFLVTTSLKHGHKAQDILMSTPLPALLGSEQHIGLVAAFVRVQMKSRSWNQGRSCPMTAEMLVEDGFKTGATLEVLLTGRDTYYPG